MVKRTNDYLKREQLVCQLSHGWNQEQKTQCPIGYEFEPRRGNENDSEYASLQLDPWSIGCGEMRREKLFTSLHDFFDGLYM